MRAVAAIGCAIIVNVHFVSSQRSATELADDDRRIWQAVLADTLFPEARRLSRRNPTPLPVLSNTVSMCETRRNLTCVTRAQIEPFLKERIGSWTLGPEPGIAIPDPKDRAALIASLVNRNPTRQPLPLSGTTDVTLVPVEAEPDLMVRDRDSSRYSGFTYPGYINDNHALVYGFYACGARCGTGWLFLLEKRGAEWLVQSRYMLWIR